MGSTWSFATYGGASAGAVPGAGDDVSIGGGFSVTVPAAAACTSLSFQSATNNTSTLTINSGVTLTVSGAVTIPRANNTFVNTLAVGDGALSAGSIAFTNGGAAGTARHLLSINTGTATISGSVTQNGSTGSATITFTGAGLLKVANTFLTPSTATLTPGTGTIEYNGAAQTISVFTYYGLALSGSGAKTLTGVTSIGGNLTLSGTATAAPPSALTIGGSVILGVGTTFTAGAFTHNVAGNWTNNGGTFISTNSTIKLNGAAAQTIGGTSSTSFYGLTFSNTFGTKPQIALAINTTVTNKLTMTSGVTNLAGFTLTLSSNSAASLSHSLTSGKGWLYGGSFTRAIPSTAITLLSADGFFPMGTSANFRPFFVGKTSNGSSAGNISISHTGAITMATVVSIPDGTTIIRRDNDSWAVSTSGSAAGATYGIRYGGTGLGTVTSLSHLHSCLASSVVGTHVTASTNSTSDPRVERSALTHANLTNSFYVGTDNLASPLPIELLAFNVSLHNLTVNLNWSTVSELNNDFFTIERASDFEKFEEVTTVKGQGTINSKTNYSVTDENPLTGISYYRLKQTDFDGKYTYSDLRKIENSDSKTRFTIYPNPVIDHKFNFEMTGISPGIEVPVRIVNMHGAPVFEASYFADQKGRIKSSVLLDQVSSGMYLMIINTSTGLRSKIVIP